MTKDQSTTSHPAVRRTIDLQSSIFFSQIAQKHVTRLLTFGTTALGLLALSFLINTVFGGPPSAGGEVKHDSVVASISQALLFVAMTYFVVGMTNRRNRTRFFASALSQTAGLRGWRDRFQVTRVFKGGKIGRVLSDLGFRKRDHIDIQWTFFYREEHSSRLFEDCIKSKLDVRILLCSPSSDSLLTRVKDMKRDYDGSWSTAFAELSLGNLTFAREFISAAKTDVRLLEHCQVRFTNTYVGRPQVIIHPAERQDWLGRTYRSLRSGALSFFNFFLSDNFVSDLKRLRVGVGIYLTQESSKYPFFEFRPEPVRGDSNLVPHDTAELFEARWEAATTLCDDGDMRKAIDIERAMVWIHREEQKIYDEERFTPKAAPRNDPEPAPSTTATVRPTAPWIQLGHNLGDPAPTNDWKPGASYKVSDYIQKIQGSLASEAIDHSTPPDPQTFEPEGVNVSAALKNSIKSAPRDSFYDRTWVKLAIAVVVLSASLFFNYLSSTDPITKTFAHSGATPADLARYADWTSIVFKTISIFTQTISVAILFSVIEPRSLEEQFEGCRTDLAKFIADQSDFGIVNIVEGGKFYDIISHMEVGHGDFIFIHWSYLQHEQASEDFGRRIVEDNLFVRMMLMEPFSIGLARRMQDLNGNYNSLPASMWASKSCGNLDFIRRRGLYEPAEDSDLGGPQRFDVRYSPLEMGRPMIIVCKPKDRAAPIDFDNLRVRQVAMGHFLTGESSKYPFIIFGGKSDSEDEPPPVCADALDFFAYRWKTASGIDAEAEPSAEAASPEHAKTHPRKA